MNTPTFNLNLSFFDERDNLQSVKPSTNENMSKPNNLDTSSTYTGELNTDTVTNKVSSSDDIFTSFCNEFPFLDELFTPFDANETKQEKPTQPENASPEKIEEENMNENVDPRHNILDEEGLNAFSAANSEKKTKYSTTWAVKTFKGNMILCTNMWENE